MGIGWAGRVENFTTSTKRSSDGTRSLKIHNSGARDGLQTINHLSNQPSFTGNISVDFYELSDNRSKGSVFSAADQNNSNYLIFQIEGSQPNFVYRIQDQQIDSKIPRTTGWHNLTLNVTKHGSYGTIDGNSLSPLGVNYSLTDLVTISLGRGWGKEGNTYFDNLRVTSLPDLPQSQQVILDSWSDEVYRIYKDSDLSEVISSLSSQRTHGIARSLSDQAMMHFYYYLRDNRLNDLDKAKWLTRIVIDNYQYWGKMWLSPITTNQLAFNVWGMWNFLDSDLRSDFLEILSISSLLFTQSPKKHKNGYTF